MSCSKPADNGTTTSNQFKIIVIGPRGSGKTSLINCLLNKQVQSSYQPTKGAKVHYCMISDSHKWSETTLNYLIFTLNKRVKTFSLDSNMSRPNTGESDIKNVVIYDVGGDEINHVLLPLLLAPKDIVLLVYNAHAYYFSTASYTVVLDHILQSVSFNCSAQCCKDDLSSTHSPQILMVGTHADLLSSKAMLTIADSLSRHSNGKLFKKHLSQSFFHFVSCKTHKLKENMERLQDTILSSAKPLYELNLPVAYLQYEAEILSRYKCGIYLEKVEALNIAHQIGIVSVEELFEFFKFIGVILYYPNLEELKDYIFISLCTIMKLLSVVTAKENHHSLHMERHLWSLHASFSRLSLSDKNLAVRLFLNFKLVGYLPSDVKFGKNLHNTCFLDGEFSYLVPSHLNNATEQLSDCIGPSVIFWFPDRFLPKYVFHQLLAEVTSWCYSKGHKFKSITSDSGCFLFEGNNCHQFKLKYFDDCIKCSIAVLYGEAKNAKEVHCPYPEVLARLRTALDNICALFLPSAQKPVCHLECPLFHNTDNKISPHLPLDEISKEHDVICGIENRMIPKEHYNLFLGLNCRESDDFQEALDLALKKGKAKPFHVRMLVVGTENAGKTSLVHSLLNEEFKPNKPTQENDLGIFKTFSTNWLQLSESQMYKKLQEDYHFKLKSTARRMSLCQSDILHHDNHPDFVTLADNKKSPESNTDVPLALGDEKELLAISDAVVNAAQLSSPAYNNDINAVFWDVSGQTAYRGLLSPFLTELNVTAIVFNASQDLFTLHQPKGYLHNDDSLILRMTGFEVICYWLSSIYSRCHKQATKDALSRFLPTVFLVATHIDLIGDGEAIERKKSEIIGLLAKAFEGKHFAKLLAGNCGGNGIEKALKKYCFFVSNLDRDPIVFDELRSALVKASQHILSQQYPMVYAKIECNLLGLKKNLISASEFIDIAHDCGLEINIGSEEYSNAQHYFHCQGSALHFPSIKSLQNWHVLSPDWLVKLSTYAFVAYTFEPTGDIVDRQYKCLKKYGVLHEELLDHMVDNFNSWQNSDFKISSEVAIDIGRNFNLIVDIDGNTKFLNGLKDHDCNSKSNDKLYLVHCRLPKDIPEVTTDPLLHKVLNGQVHDQDTDKEVRIVYFQFPDGYAPEAVFFQLMALYMKRNAARSEEVVDFSRRHCKLVLGNDQLYYILLNQSKESICLIFSPDEVEIVGSEGIRERLDLLKNFRNDLTNIMKDTNPTLMNPVPYIPCPQCSGLHFSLDFIYGITCRRALRCGTKISAEYYSDFRQTADDKDGSSPCGSSHDSPLQSPHKRRRLPGTPTLPLWITYLKDVTTKWKQFATFLLPPESAATEINTISSNYQGNVDECKMELYYTFARLGKTTWERVVDALEKSGHSNLAEEIKTDFNLH